VAYAAAAAAFLTWLVRPQMRLARAGRALLVIGVVVHFAAFGVSLGVAGAGLGVPAWKGGQLFSLLAAVTVAGYLVLHFRYAPAVARPPRPRRISPRRVGIRLPLAGHRHRLAGLPRSHRVHIPHCPQAGLRDPRLGALRLDDPGEAGRRLAWPPSGDAGGGWI